MLDLDIPRSAICLDTCLDVKASETVAVLYDTNYRSDAVTLAQYATSQGATSRLVEVPARKLGHKDISPEAQELLEGAEVVVVVFDPEDACQFWHSRARMQASDAGTRIGLLFPPASWDITHEDLVQTQRLTDRLTELLHAASEARIVTDAGTDITMSLVGRAGYSSHSILHEAGATATIPDWGDAEVSPLEGTANGTIVYDGSIAFIGKLDRPITVQVVDGMAVSVEGGTSADELRRILEAEGPSSRNIAELGIGTVPRGVITGHKDDKLFGTAHLALGHNVSLGGTVDATVHLDGVFHNPTLWLDGREVLVGGRLADWLADEIDRSELAAGGSAR